MPLLFVTTAIINSSIATAYIKDKYMSSSYCGGLKFTPKMIESIPVPDISGLLESKDEIHSLGQAINANDRDYCEAFVHRIMGVQ